MKRLFRKFMDMCIHRQLIISFILVVVLPFLLLGFIQARNSGLLMEEHLTQVAESMHKNNRTLLNEALSRFMTLVDQYMQDTVLVHSLRQPYGSALEALDLYDMIWQRQKNAMLTYPYLRGILLYTENETMVDTTPYVLRTSGYFKDLLIYGQVRAAGYAGVWGRVKSVQTNTEYWNPKNDAGGTQESFCYVRMLDTRRPNDPGGAYICVEIHDRLLDNILGGQESGDMVNFLVDERNEPMRLSSLMPVEPDWLPPGDAAAEQAHLGSVPHLVWKSRLVNGWSLVSVASLEQVFGQARTMRLTSWLTVAVLGMLVIVFIWLLGYGLTRRVKRLMDNIVGFQVEKWQHYEPMEGNNEISVLDRVFVDMADRLHESVQREYILKVRRKEAELSLLHSQINPHFLYNMLSSIAWLADTHPPQTVRSAIENLATYYRLSLSKGRELITLEEEVRGLTAYMALQKLRFGEKICFVADVDYALGKTQIPRMTLQPLVENSLIHGPGPDRRPIGIVLTGELQEECVCLVLEDDGVGMDEERLLQLQSGRIESSCGGGIGYKLVDERIRLQFGQAYGISVDSAPGKGTRILIQLPLPGQDAQFTI